MRISKSDYVMFKNCSKSLWLKKNQKGLFRQIDQTLKDNSREVEKTAQQLFSGGVEVEYNEILEIGAQTTTDLIAQNVKTIFGATFITSNTTVICDILTQTKNGWEIYEVKSSTKFEDEYLNDVAFQLNTLKNSGINVSKVSVIYLNSKYVRSGKLDLNQLFTVEDKTIEANNLLLTINGDIILISQLLNNTEPQTNINKNCSDCDCKKHCWKHIPENSVFDLSGMHLATKIKHFNNNIITFDDVINNNIKISNKNSLQINYVNGGEYIDKVEIRNFMNTLTFPLYFLDFETFQQPIPLFDNLSSYDQIPFQYSLHIMEKPTSTLLYHKDFFAKAGTDPRREFAEKIIRDIPLDVCIIAYHASFEKTIIKELALLYPHLSNELMTIHNNIKDLEIPFSKGYYYNNEMKGKSSIKLVLPALTDLSYADLEIQNGGIAMNKYASLHKKSEIEIKETRMNLLKYCLRDTFAMVAIYSKLLMTIGISVNLTEMKELIK